MDYLEWIVADKQLGKDEARIWRFVDRSAQHRIEEEIAASSTDAETFSVH